MLILEIAIGVALGLAIWNYRAIWFRGVTRTAKVLGYVAWYILLVSLGVGAVALFVWRIKDVEPYFPIIAAILFVAFCVKQTSAWRVRREKADREDAEREQAKIQAQNLEAGQR